MMGGEATLQNVQALRRQTREPIAVQIKHATHRYPRGEQLRVLEFHRGANITRIGVVPPNPAMQKVKPAATNRTRCNPPAFEVHDLIAIILPAEAVIWSNSHGVYQADSAGERTHILAGAAAREKYVRSR